MKKIMSPTTAVVFLLFLCIPCAKAQTEKWQELVNRRQYAEVIAQAGNLNPADSADFGKMYALALAYEGMLKYPDTLDICDTALYYNPNNLPLKRSKAMALFVNKKFAQADTLYSSLLMVGDSLPTTVAYGGFSRYYVCLKSDIPPEELDAERRLLTSFPEDTFFRNQSERTMIAPDGKKSLLSVNILRSLIARIPTTPLFY
ncbi:MAG: hypothetical protein LBB84_03995 [Tannerellaceae bacterium]|jgi:tetratricopeptide (TPR) repeat protein|nr:hypothetical protein [Tannerellaceae bacterium]